MLFLISFLFSVVCFAAPPPDEVPVYVPDQVQLTVQDVAQVAVYTVEAREVAYNYLGDFELSAYQDYIIEQVAKLEFPELIMDDDSYSMIDELNKPPANSDFTGRLINKQHTNYGYPFTGNTCYS